VLPDDVLLAVFGFYVFKYRGFPFFSDPGSWDKRSIESWQSLGHVCRRWRGLLFGSPRHLNLELFWKPNRKFLDVWPAFPLVIYGKVYSAQDVDNVISGLEHSDDIRRINLGCCTASTLQIEKLWTAMQVSFPELTFLDLTHHSLEVFPDSRPVLPDSFLGGSAPRLQFLALDYIPFPELPKLLLSTTQLVTLWLMNIPHSGYFSPEAMAICLPVLTSLEILHLEFSPRQLRPDQESRRPPPPTRTVLPALTKFWFDGATKYLEELVAHIDAPWLYQLSIKFKNDVDSDTPELKQFISRTPAFRAYNQACLVFGRHETRLQRIQ
jgi:hypothetical protein